MMKLSEKDIIKLVKNSELSLELLQNTKTNINQSELNKFVNDVKRISAKKDVVLVLVEKCD